MNTKSLTAIVFFNDGRRPHKYRNCHITNFTQYAEKINAWYINFYNPKTKEFIQRVYLKEKPLLENRG